MYECKDVWLQASYICLDILWSDNILHNKEQQFSVKNSEIKSTGCKRFKPLQLMKAS